MSLKLYKRFHDARPDEMIVVNDEEFEPEEKMVLVGELVGVAYRAVTPSNSKPSDTIFVHEFAEKGGECPLLLAGESGHTLYVLGGTFEVSDWIHG